MSEDFNSPNRFVPSNISRIIKTFQRSLISIKVVSTGQADKLTVEEAVARGMDAGNFVTACHIIKAFLRHCKRYRRKCNQLCGLCSCHG